MSPLKQEEDKYCRMVYPTEMSKNQRREIAMAFNSGALSTLALIGGISDKCTEDEGVKALSALMKEVEARCTELSDLPAANPHN